MHERVWRAVLGASLAVGVGAALLEGAGLAGLASGAAFAVVLGVAERATSEARTDRLARAGGPGDTAARGILVTTGFLAFFGLAEAFGGVSLLLVVALALAAPPVAGLLRRRRPGTTDAALTTDPGRLCRVRTRDLVEIWATSQLMLDGPLTPPARAWVVEYRRRVLDELERRDPVGLDQWLRSSSARDCDPGAFVRDYRI